MAIKKNSLINSNTNNFSLNDSNNRYYQRALSYEIESMESKVVPEWPPIIDFHPIVNRYHNANVSGLDTDSEADWFDILVDRFGSFETGLSLGTGTGLHERLLQKKGFVKNWSTIDLSTTSQNSLDAEFSQNNFENGDLNFITLPVKKYDVVFCSNVLHHIVNLEHLLFEINKTLTDDGLFLVYEFIGEDQWEWSDKKLKILNQKFKTKFESRCSGLDFVKYPRWSLNERPLESIRSSELHSIIKYYFGNSAELEIVSDMMLFPIINSLVRCGLISKLEKDPKLLDEMLNFAVQLDKESMLKEEDLLPCYLAGVYRKSEVSKPLLANSWSDAKIKQKLHLPLPLHLKSWKFIKKCIKRVLPL